MNYAKITNGAVEVFPASLDGLVALGHLSSNAPTSDELAAAGVVEVAKFSGSIPKDKFNYKIDAIQQQDGTWAESWIQVETPPEIMQKNIDATSQAVIYSRNELLQLSDWTQLPDAPISNKQEWAVYRQALRDVPAQAGFPFEVNWPTRP